MSCYTFQKTQYTDPFFKDVKATYIIHLEGNGRLDDINKQLQTYHPTETVYIVFNKGFKKCEKSKRIDKAPLDLIDAFYTIFKDATNKGYENILVLEDDFFFDEKVKNEECVKDIEDFLREKQNKEYIYYLGEIPWLQTAMGGKHHTILFSTGTHACIYSNKFMKKMVEKVKQESIVDWDSFTNLSLNTLGIRYKYDIPLCYQLFPDTDNRKHWSGTDMFSMKYIYGSLIISAFKLMKLDTQVHPGYEIMEFCSRFIFWFILLTVCILYFFIFSFMKTIKFKKLNWKKILGFMLLFAGIYALYMITLTIVLYIAIYVSTLFTFS
jgi:hypothetical protein